MLSSEEKKEMLKDALDKSKRDDFRFAGKLYSNKCSLDEFLVFLNSVQKVFAPFKASSKATITKLNRI